MGENGRGRGGFGGKVCAREIKTKMHVVFNLDAHRAARGLGLGGRTWGKAAAPPGNEPERQERFQEHRGLGGQGDCSKGKQQWSPRAGNRR